MLKVLLTFFATATLFLGVSSYMQAKGSMVINPVYTTQQDADQLTAYLTAQQVEHEK